MLIVWLDALLLYTITVEPTGNATEAFAGITIPPVVVFTILPMSVSASVYDAVWEFCGIPL